MKVRTGTVGRRGSFCACTLVLDFLIEAIVEYHKAKVCISVFLPPEIHQIWKKKGRQPRPPRERPEVEVTRPEAAAPTEQKSEEVEVEQLEVAVEVAAGREEAEEEPESVAEVKVWVVSLRL